MTLRKIARLGHPILLERARAVEDVEQAEVQRLVDDMLETMADAQGIGLAAPQVYASHRIVLASELENRAERAGARVHVLVNPELTVLDEGLDLAFEGCLSIPQLRGRVPRYRHVAYRAVDRFGRRVEGEARGLFARILQHEVDHLDGILYPMRMTDLRHLAFAEEIHHLTAWMARQGEQA